LADYEIFPSISIDDSGSPLSRRIVYASTIAGVVLDCDLDTGLKIGGGVATDNTVRLNAVLSVGSKEKPITLIIDGASLISSSLNLPVMGHASIVGMGWDTGFFLKSGSNSDIIHNGGPTANRPTDPGGGVGGIQRGANVSIANLRLNGNGANVRKVFGAGFNMGINLMDLNNITIRDVWMYDCVTYGLRLSNCGSVLVNNYRCESPSRALNTDGVHLSGGCNDIVITNCYFAVGDDSIALNAPEGRGGDIHGVTIIGCTYFYCLSMTRIYAANNSADCKISGVKFIGGEYHQPDICPAVIIIGDQSVGSPAGAADGILDVLFQGCNFFGITVDLVNLTNPVRYLHFDCCVIFDPKQNITWMDVNSPISALKFSNCSVQRSSAGGSQVTLIFYSASVGVLTVNGFGIEDALGYTAGAVTPSLLNPGGGQIKRLNIVALDLTSYTALIGTFGGTIGLIYGSGVRATGTEFPDVVMANATEYLSATTHKPSIKIEGVVKTYTLI
jgi:hypothetical protein